MVNIVKMGDSATCGHTASPGSPNVFVKNLAVIRCLTDQAQGIILPGAANKQTVFINNFPVSVNGDQVTDHGKHQHNSANMIGTELTVSVY